MNEPLVSVLIPFKNTSAFLEACLQSICDQQYKNWEVLAVNDHSTDASRAILEHFAEKDPRIHVFDNEGSGIIPALQKGYKESTGVFITRMDSDDVMTANKLRVMVQSLLEKGRGHLAVGQVKYFSNRGISNGYERYEAWLNQLTATGNNYAEIYKECVIPSPCWMIHRKDLDVCGAFDANRYPEDYDLTFRFYEKKITCIPCGLVLHHWRDYDTRTSRTSEHYAQNYFLEIKLHYFLKLDYDVSRPLVVWGAGKKGKTVAKSLIDKGVAFLWVCDNPLKIDKNIYGQRMLHYSEMESMPNSQSIITVANEISQKEIRTYFKSHNQRAMRDYFFFC